jgi:hypothetical protein
MNARTLLFRIITVAVAAWIAAGSAAHADPPVYLHPDPATTGQTFYPISQAYATGVVQANAGFSGERRVRTPDVVVGKLDLASKPGAGGSIDLDQQAFATFKAGIEHAPVVVTVPNPDPTKAHLAPRLTIVVPSSASYLSLYPGLPLVQLEGIRTHWVVAGNPPGTKFTLDIGVDCISNSTGAVVRHIDRWTWSVVSDFASLRAVIDLLHSIPVGISGDPPLASETAFQDISARFSQIQAKVQASNFAGAKADIASLQSALASYAGSNSILSTSSDLLGYEAIGVELEAIASQLP